MTIADVAWLATAMLHKENPQETDFSVKEIAEKARQEKLVAGFRSGLQVHISKHCVANKSPNPAVHRMLYKTVRGRRRLFRPGDDFHRDRAQGKMCPVKDDLLPTFRPIVDWYETVYANPASESCDSASQVQSISVGETSPETPAQGISSAANEALRVLAGKAIVGAGGTFTIPEFLRKELGIEDGTLVSTYREENRLILQPVNEAFISSLVGCCKGKGSLVAALEHERRMEKDRLPR